MSFNNNFKCSRPFRPALRLNGKLSVTDILEVNNARAEEG